MIHLVCVFMASQRSAVLASYLGCTVDAFDLFILVFVNGRHRGRMRHPVSADSPAK